MKPNYFPEPFRIKSVEPLAILTEEERAEKIAAAHYNVFALAARDVTVDLLTDSGTGAMSAAQWAGVMVGDESYAGAESYYKLQDSAKDVFGMPYIQLVHQGRAAEKVLLPILLEGKKYAIANMHFDTTRAHVELAGARAVDCVVKEALDTATYYDFKGNMDCDKLESLIAELGEENVGVVIMTITNNSAGGQPVSVENIRRARDIAHRHKIPFMIDAARCAENAYFIKRREPAYKNSSVKEIVRACFEGADCFTMSAKKDAIVNMGGLIGCRNEALFEAVKQRTISFEGFVTYGGMSGRDIEALACGLQEGLDENYLRYRIGQMEYLAARLDDAGIPYQSPVGGHAVFVDAKKLLPHIPYYQFPAQALAVELYKEAGVRACEIGSFLLGNDPDTGKQLQADFEFTRLAIPRRVYTQSHLDAVADALIHIKERAREIKGYEIEEEPPILRHFTAKLRPVQ